MTLAETLKDCESEIATLKSNLAQKDADVLAGEERCSHLVRLGEQRHQESLGLQAQLNTVQDKAKEMLLSQGAEISRANIHVSELYSRLEKLIAGSEVSSLSSTSATREEHPAFQSGSFPGSSFEDDVTSGSGSNAEEAPNLPPAFANFQVVNYLNLI